MDKKEIHLTVVSPEKTLFDGTVGWIELPGEKGRFQVLYNHAALISSLVEGDVVFGIGEPGKRSKDDKSIRITGGFVEISNNLVSVCIETA